MYCLTVSNAVEKSKRIRPLTFLLSIEWFVWLWTAKQKMFVIVNCIKGSYQARKRIGVTFPLSTEQTMLIDRKPWRYMSWSVISKAFDRSRRMWAVTFPLPMDWTTSGVGSWRAVKKSVMVNGIKNSWQFRRMSTVAYPLSIKRTVIINRNSEGVVVIDGIKGSWQVCKNESSNCRLVFSSTWIWFCRTGFSMVQLYDVWCI